MPPEAIEAMAALLSIVSVGGLILIGMRIRYSHIQRTRVSGTTQPDTEGLASNVDQLQEEVRLLRDEVMGLNERVEFTERLLERPKTTDR